MSKFSSEHIIFILVSAMLSLSVVSCGGASGEENDDVASTDSNGAQNVSSNIDSLGGKIELPGVATITFPEGSFKNTVTAKAYTSQIDDRTMEIYEMAREMRDTGEAYGTVLIVEASEQPKQEMQLDYVIPEDIVRQMGTQKRPALLARYLQFGADDEVLDDFYALKSHLSGNTLTATVPNWVFTNERPESHGVNQTIIVLASYRTADRTTSDKSFFLSSASQNSCGASEIGSPVGENLNITSDFGSRIHPVTGQDRPHRGIDIRANTGDNVLAVADGTISNIGFDYNQTSQTGYGRYVVLLHVDGSQTKYAHLLEESTNGLHIGDHVNRGDVIGRADSTGGVTGPHLHLEYELADSVGDEHNQIDPLPCIVSPLRIGAVQVDEVVYWPYFQIPFSIDVNVPQNNHIDAVGCQCDAGLGNTDYNCRVGFDESENPAVRGHIGLLHGPRGVATITVQIRDAIGSVYSTRVSGTWECCDSNDLGYYMGVIRSCIALDDTSLTTLCPVR